MTDYWACREEFIQLAELNGYRVFRYRIPQEESSELFQEYALLKRDPKKLLIHISGVHGIEGYAGSLIQRELLKTKLGPNGPSILFLHSFNPFGMAFYRRANYNNVDLNRNYRKGPAQPNDDYKKFASLFRGNDSGIAAIEILSFFINSLRMGKARAMQAIAGGQVSDAKGIFYMGTHLQREFTLSSQVFRQHFSEAEEVVCLDIHTGLGRFGQETLYVENPDSQFVDFFNPIRNTSTAEYETQANLGNSIVDCFSNAKVHYALQEFGTRSNLKVLFTLRAENIYWNFERKSESKTKYIKELMLDTFYPDNIGWRNSLIAKGIERFNQSLSFLERPK